MTAGTSRDASAATHRVVAGALALLLLLVLGAGRADAATREYWIAAVNTEIDLAPNGGDPVEDRMVPASERRFTGVVYRRYTRGWKRPWTGPAEFGQVDGIPGPTIRAVVGDRVIVHFRNLDRHHGLPHSMHFHAFRYAPSSDGAFIPYRSTRGGNVPVGSSWTYRLRAVTDSVGVWPYHDHSTSVHRSLELGLYGAISVRARGERPPDREFNVFMGLHRGFNTINGRAFIGNTPTFRARVGETVQWNVLTLGDDFHVFHIHGHRWRRHGTPVDSEVLGPSSTLRVRFKEDAPGVWYYHCHVESHLHGGMVGLYRVTR